MSVVKGSEQSYLMIHQYKPWQRFRRRFYWLLFLIATGAGGYFAGTYDSYEQLNTLTSSRDYLQMKLDEAEHTITNLSQRVNVLEKGGEVDRQATEGIRQTVKELKSQISTLEEEVAFYKGIMAPSSNDKGLRVNKIDVAALTETPGSYKYSIMLTQVQDNSSYIAGLAAVNFIGLRNGERVILPLRDLDEKVTELGVKFRFRYYQEVTGDISLPEGFIPEQVQVVLQSTGSKAQRVEQSVDWPQ